ncbi:MAG: hypothetical protein K0M45_01155 [Candidatus Paracaedibacteraceae bacterium]|nr:hypothetical protein [Candidatus Paracaedibacteraceae bacterium]
MTKFFALIILSLLTPSMLPATQVGAASMGQQQAMADNDNGANPDDSNTDGSDGNDNGADQMDNLQPPTDPQDMNQAPQGMDDPQADPNGDTQSNPDGSPYQQMQTAQTDGDQTMDSDPNGTTEISTVSQPDQPTNTVPNDPNHPEVKHQQKLKGIDYIHQLQNTLLEGNKQAMCGEGGICRKNFGEGCRSSKNFLSVCATICGDIGEFRGSHCINNGAKRYQMNPQTFVYNARPDKQKSAESVIQHIAVQLREGRNALRDDKRLFFNTVCTPPSIQMIPEIDRKVLARACLDFLYNGYPPEAALRQLAAEENGQTPQTIASFPAIQTGGDDIRDTAPLGGLTCHKGLGRDKGAEYKGKYPPIIEDKESAEEEECEEPVKKKKVKKKVHKKKTKKKAQGRKKHKTAPRPTAKKHSPKATSTNRPVSGSNKSQAESVSSNANVDDQDDPDSQIDQSSNNNQPAPSSPQTQQNQTPSQQQAQAPAKKDNLLAGLGGAGGLGGIINKFTHQKGGNAMGGDQSSEDGNANANGKPGGKENKLTGALGKFLKF